MSTINIGMKYNEILSKKDEIINWIQDSNNTISNAEIAKRLKVRISTWMKYNKRLEINYKGNQSKKGITAANDARVRAVYNKDVFKKNKYVESSIIRKHLLHVLKREYKCSVCNITKWHTKPITLHVDHINGDRFDNRIENLRFICPNCHSQTETYCVGSNKNKNRTQIKDIDLIKAYKEHGTVSKTLLTCKLTQSAGNTERVKRLIIKYNL